MKIKKIVALTAACAMLSSTAGFQIITIDGEGTALSAELIQVTSLPKVSPISDR